VTSAMDIICTSTPRRNFDESPRMVPARRGMEIGAKRNHGGGGGLRPGGLSWRQKVARERQRAIS